MGELFHSKPWITADDEAAVQAVLRSGLLTQGAHLPRFEGEMSNWLGVAGGVGVGSGGAALELSLRALECGPRAEVILPTYVCRTVLDAVVAVGANPVLCDVGPNWVVRAADIAPHVTAKTRAVIVPHLYGIYADLAAIRQLGLPVIEDAAQALGTSRQHAAQGDLVILSFHPTKCLTTAEGGMVLSRDAGLLARCRRGRDVGSESFGRQFSPLSEISAALGLSQLARYAEFLQRRQAIARSYQKALSGLTGLDLGWCNEVDTMFFRFPIKRAGGLESCQAAFQKSGIHVRRGVDELLHRLLGLPDAQFPSAVAHFFKTISLPIYPALDSTQMETVAATAARILGTNG